MSIHELFESQVLLNPDSLALKFGTEAISYSSFNTYANQLACQLTELGVQRDVCVGVMMDRSFEMMVAIFAILKAGGAYVPVDPEYPDERIRFIFTDARVEILLTQEKFSKKFNNYPQQIITPDLTNWSFANFPDTNPNVHVTPSDLAYILFTSGSTGQPKGVMVEHHSVVNLILYVQQLFPLAAEDVVLFKSPYTFDGSIWEIFGWMLMGGMLYIAPPGAEKNPMVLANLIRTERINFMFFVPSMLQAYLNYASILNLGPDFKTLKWVSVGGEVLPVPLVKLFYKVFNGIGTRLINVYGPTETTVYATTMLCKPDEEYEKVPIGAAVTNDVIYILDDNLEPVAMGEEGEICICGAGVARGYLNQPDSTAKKFVPDPFIRNGTIYRTGDVGRQLAGNLFDFIGRRDFQVKLRGLRVEIGEIEHAMLNISFITGCAVLFTKDSYGDDCLVAYVTVNNPNESPGTHDFSMATPEFKDTVNHSLGLLLPLHMIPAEVVVCCELPLSEHGKIDRKRLPGLASLLNPALKKVFIPQSATGERVFNIWKNVLGHDQISVEDDFFGVGGHSLKAIQVITSVISDFGVEIPMKAFYDHLTINSMAQLIEKLVVTDKSDEFTTTCIDSPQKVYPLTPFQVELWAVNGLDPTGITHNIQLEFTLLGSPEIPRILNGIDQIVQQEELFRSVFPIRGDEPVQEILDKAVFCVESDDLSALDNRKKEIKYSRIVREHGRIRFKLDQLPLLSFRLIKWSEHEHRLLMTIHHLVFDGWSLQLFVHRLKEIYDGGELPRRGNYRIGDFAIWLQRKLRTKVANLEVSYWKNALPEIPHRLTLPLKPDVRQLKNGYEGKRYWWIIPADISNALGALALSRQTTPFVMMMTAWQIVLSAYSGQRDIVVGTPYANRKHPGIGDLMGYFTNMVAIWLHIKDNERFMTLVSQCNEKSIGAFSNSWISFGELINRLKFNNEQGTNPVFQTILVMQNWPAVEGKFNDFHLSQREIGNDTCKLDLILNVEKTFDHYTCWLEFDVSLYEEELIRELAEDVNKTLAAVTSLEEIKISELLGMLSRTSAGILKSWNSTQCDYPLNKCIHHLFEEQVCLHPDSISVTGDKDQLTYQELNARANQLAHSLSRSGAAVGSLIGVMVERGVNLPVALLAILKAGCAYIPMDPLYPPKRLGMILEDGNPVMILTEKKLQNNLPATPIKHFLIDDTSHYPNETSDNPNHLLPSESLAYLIYTSGTTGKPKGVGIKHSALTNFLLSMQKKPGINPGDVLMALTTISFDIAALELWLPLVTGASVVISGQETAADPDLLADRITKFKPTLIQATPVTFQMLLAAGWRGSDTLKILCGGEALTTKLAGELFPLCHELWNMYGPTETTIWSTIHKVQPIDLESSGYITLGKPIDNTSIFVLNEAFLPVPVGHPGELFIGGDGLALGYHHLPGLTKEKFIPNPFDEKLGARLYRTGDLVKFAPDGNLIYLNRSDFQVKIRGYRIEPGEIESALATCPGITKCVVIAHETKETDKVLIAFLSSGEPEKPDQTDLRKYLKSRLPEYMIPAYLVFVDQFPLTPNGKIDRKALPVPADLSQVSSGSFITPATKAEQKLAVIWSELLQIKTISIDDNFFDLGGNSLLAVRLMVAIEKESGKRLPLATLFEHGTIRKMARLIDVPGDQVKWKSLVPIRPGGYKKPLFLVHAAGLNLLLYKTVAEHLDPEQPVYGLQAKGLDGKEEPLDTIEAMASHYIAEIQSVEKDGPYALAGFCMGGTIAFEMARQLETAGKKVSFVGLFETNAYQPAGTGRSIVGHFLNRTAMLARQVNWNIQWLLHLPNNQQKAFLAIKFQQFGRRFRKTPEIALQESNIDGTTGVLPAYTRSVRNANEKALEQYILKPWKGNVYLFRAMEQTFYIEDRESYGWNKFITGGIKIFDIPGAHSWIFAPPYDHIFAEKLQKALDDSNSGNVKAAR